MRKRGRALQATKRFFNELIHQISTLHHRHPTIEAQTEAGDCGYVCMSAAMAMLGRPMLVHDIKACAGTTTRGLTLRQLRDGLRACGAKADAVFFDPSKPECYPCMGIVLLSHGHYIFISRRKGNRFEVFEPQLGWSWSSFRKLARQCGGLGVEVRGLSEIRPVSDADAGTGRMPLLLKTIMAGRSGRAAMATLALAQLVTLALPLLSMWSVDRSVGGLSVGIVGAIGIGFVALSLTNIFIALSSELIQSKMKRIASVSMSRLTFDSLAEKSAYWFEVNSSASLQNRVASVRALLDFYVDVVRTLGSFAVTFTVGLAVLIFVSPWLLVPGLCALLLSMILDLMFEKSQRDNFASAVETSQRRQAFVLETLTQLPLIARFSALSTAKIRFASVVRGAAMVEARLQSVRGWRTALGNLSKSGETLFFVTLAAAFMGTGNFTIGGFVALGAYKDLLANSIGSMFQLALRRRSLEVHKLQAAALLTSSGKTVSSRREIQRGEVTVECVSFAYGSLERPIIDGLDFYAQPGECVVIRGPSGSGKSTVAKLLVGQLVPCAGTITIDGLPLADSMAGMAAVLQSDRLIGGTVRENVALFRRGLTDADILAALKVAALDEFVLSLPMRLNTIVGEGVGGLSGGQRQRLLIARAALERPRLVILDEATSSLEVEVEGRILQELRRSGATTILLAHRPEVWALADRIYTFTGDGRLIEETTYPPVEIAGSGPTGSLSH